MGTYYRWARSNIGYTETTSSGTLSYGNSPFAAQSTGYACALEKPPLNTETGLYTVTGGTYEMMQYTGKAFAPSSPYGSVVVFPQTVSLTLVNESGANNRLVYYGMGISYTKYSAVQGKGTFIDYVYSTSPSAYPNGGVSGDYYYDQRTTVESPAAPTGLTYPNPITTSSVTVSWTAATSNVPSYAVNLYELSYSTNGGSTWTSAGTTADTSMNFSVTPGMTSLMFRVRARDSNGQWGDYMTGTAVQVLLLPTLTVPSIAMQGQQITPNWTAVEGADSYTLQRKSSADEDWVEVYSGADTSYTETVGTWTSIQYRVQAVFDDTPGGWETSDSIPVISASALVISGQDGDLGTLVNDVPYTISTDTGNPITIRTTVNGAVILDGTITSGTAERIPVLDLVSGSGTIVIEASVETDSGPVSAVRTWTYDKAPITFPNAGSPAQLTKEGKSIWPKTLAECVRLSGGRTLEEVMGFPCQIFVGRYTGTGTYGSGDPNEVTIPFKPQAVFVTSGSVGTTIPMIRPCTSAKNSSATLTVTWEDDSVSWYSTSAVNQLNANGTTYDVVAFG